MYVEDEGDHIGVPRLAMLKLISLSPESQLSS